MSKLTAGPHLSGPGLERTLKVSLVGMRERERESVKVGGREGTVEVSWVGRRKEGIVFQLESPSLAPHTSSPSRMLEHTYRSCWKPTSS